MLTEALTTAAGRHATSDCAATASMSLWSMIAMSPRCRRLVRFFVRRSTRAAPLTPGPASGAGPRLSRGILTRRWCHAGQGGRPGPVPRPAGAGLAGARPPLLPFLGGTVEELARVGLRGVRVGHA